MKAFLVSGAALSLAAQCVWVMAQGAAESSTSPTLPTNGTGDVVTVYHRVTFDRDAEGWKTDRNVKSSLTNDAVDGQALRVDCERGWAGCELPIDVTGSRGLKIAVLMKAPQIESIGINAYDSIARDNTTAYGYCYLHKDRWTPMLYRLDQFRYNSQANRTVSPNTHYTSVRFYGPEKVEPGAWYSFDNFVIYRGNDREPPAQVTGLAVRPTEGGTQLHWEPAADNVAAQVYVIARADAEGPFQKIAESCATTWLDRTSSPGRHRYRVFAVDFEENYGPWSRAISIQGSSAPLPASLTREAEDRATYAQHVAQVHAHGKGKVRRSHAALFGDSLTGATVYPYSALAAFGNLTVNTHGYPSMTTSFARNKVPEIIQRENPEFMFILYGTNNNKDEKHLPQAMDDLTAVVQACEANGTVAILGTIPPRGWTPESAPEARYNQQLIALCRKLQIPAGYIFEDFQTAGNRRKYMGGDGVHWTGEGMEIAGRAWGKTLEQIRFVLRDQP